MRNNTRYKTFLTQEGEGWGSVCWDIDSEPEYGSYRFCKVRVTDCYRTVELDFGFGDKQDHNIGLEKINTFIEALQKFKDVYTTAYVEKKPRYF